MSAPIHLKQRGIGAELAQRRALAPIQPAQVGWLLNMAQQLAHFTELARGIGANWRSKHHA